MKTKNTLLGVAFAMVFSAVAGADTSILLMGNVRRSHGNIASITGANRAVIKAGGDQTTVVASEIAYDTAAKVLSCRGAATVTSGDRTIRGVDLRIELTGGSVSVFFLNPDGMLPPGTAPTFESWRPISELPQFGERLPNVHLELKTLGKSTVPTATAVP